MEGSIFAGHEESLLKNDEHQTSENEYPDPESFAAAPVWGNSQPPTHLGNDDLHPLSDRKRNIDTEFVSHTDTTGRRGLALKESRFGNGGENQLVQGADSRDEHLFGHVIEMIGTDSSYV